MNSVIMKEVLNNGVDRHDFCELVGLEVCILLYILLFVCPKSFWDSLNIYFYGKLKNDYFYCCLLQILLAVVTGNN